MSAPTTKLTKIHRSNEIEGQSQYPLGKYTVRLHFLTKQTGAPALSSPTGITAAAGGSLVAVEQQPPVSVAGAEYTDVDYKYNGPPTVAANLLHNDTTIDIEDPIYH